MSKVNYFVLYSSRHWYGSTYRLMSSVSVTRSKIKCIAFGVKPRIKVQGHLIESTESSFLIKLLHEWNNEINLILIVLVLCHYNSDFKLINYLCFRYKVATLANWSPWVKRQMHYSDKGNHFTKINLKTFLRCVDFWVLSKLKRIKEKKSDDGKIYLKSTVLGLVKGMKHVQYLYF